MIFFIHGDVGYNIMEFIIKKYPNDIKIIFTKKINNKFKNKLKKKLPLIKYLAWSDKKEKKIIDLIKHLEPKLIFLLWWPKIISKRFIKSINSNFINIHPSYLPHFKGKDPNFWSMISNGPFGVSIHYVNEKIDSGPIILRKKISGLDMTNDAEDLYKFSKKELILLFKKKYKILRNTKKKLKTFKNTPTTVNYRKDMIKKSKIDLKKRYTGEYLINLLRAKTFSPHKGVLFKKNKKTYQARIKITEVND
jgi:methionyl-tRNA formyltransferase